MESDLLQKTIGEVARAAREGLGLTQAQVARKVGLSPPVYGRVERGGMMPSVPVLRAIAVALGVPTDALLAVSSSEVPTDLSPETQKIVGLLRTWPEEKVEVAGDVLRAMDALVVPDTTSER
jgi:transcriptional regulator with XRE-family HTH domain